ncbi:MAG TPA: glycosyltransferase family 39 protein [Nitrospirota bacterium]
MTSDSAQNHHIEFRDLILLTVLLGIFFTLLPGNRSLSVPDEGRYAEISREMAVTGDYLTPRLNGVKYFEKPPLFYWLEAAMIKLFGLGERTLRVWPSLLALLGCLAVYTAGARLFDRRTGLISAAVLSTSLLYYALGRMIILDMPVTALLSAALLSFLVGAHEPPGRSRRMFFYGFYLFAALATLTKGLIGILIPGMVIGAWMLLMNEWRVLRTMHLLSGLALFLLIAAPWHILVSRANQEFFNFYFIHEHFQRYLTKVHGRYKPAWYFIPILLAGFLPWSAFLFQAIRRSLPGSWKERREHRGTVFLLLWTGLVFLFFSVSSSKLMPYILPVFPPLSLLVGRYLADAWDRRDASDIAVGYAIFLVIALALAGALVVLPRLAPGLDIQALGVHRYTVAATLASGAIIAWLFARARGYQRAFFVLLATTGLFITQLQMATPLLPTKSVKDLAATLKPLLQPGDEVVAYNMYYQDLPVYLERRITVVDWKGEMSFGTEVEDTRQWMIDNAEFLKRWQGPTTMYMLTEITTYDALRKDSRCALYPIARDRRNILVSNKEVRS